MIIALEEAKYKLQNLRQDMKELGSSLRIDTLRTNVEELEAQTLAENFWSNQENSSKILQTIKQTKDKIEAYENLCTKLEDAITLAEMAIEEQDESYLEEVESELAEIVATEEQMRTLAFYDSLTKLPNRRLFLERLEHAYAAAHARADPRADAHARAERRSVCGADGHAPAHADPHSQQ